MDSRWERLERIVLSLVKQYAPQLLTTETTQGLAREERLERLCRRLASLGLLVLACDTGDLTGNPALVQTQNWASGLARLYATLVRRLFPSYTQFEMHYIDNEQPAVMLALGEATALMQRMAGFILPYLAARHMQVASEAELRGLVEIVLEELEATDLPRQEYLALRAECVLLLQRLLSAPVRPLLLRVFDRPIFFGQTEAPPQQTSVTGRLPAMPATLPADARPRQPQQSADAARIQEASRPQTGALPPNHLPEMPSAPLPETGPIKASPEPAKEVTKDPTTLKRPAMPPVVRPTGGGPTRRPPVPPLPDDDEK
ncbi:MAG: hypothetical protein HXY40_15845 [Chloroflexi bacterium]|nr:hypothetical protein [Chloroflexota bacterium]